MHAQLITTPPHCFPPPGLRCSDDVGDTSLEQRGARVLCEVVEDKHEELTVDHNQVLLG